LGGGSIPNGPETPGGPYTRGELTKSRRYMLQKSRGVRGEEKEKCLRQDPRPRGSWLARIHENPKSTEAGISRHPGYIVMYHNLSEILFV